MVLQDGGAHKAVWHARGDGATKLCLLCKNLYTHDSGIVAEDTTGHLKANVIKWAELVKATCADLRNNARYIASQAAVLSNDAFTEIQQSLGITHHPHGILLDVALDNVFDPTKVYQHDWMHALFVDGLFNLAVYMLLEAFIVAGFPHVYQVCSDYIAKWTWPARIHGNHLHENFEHCRRDKHRKAHHIKAQASDMLSLVHVLALFTRTVLMTLGVGCLNECNSFLALVEVIELITATPRINVTPDVMLSSVEKCLELWRVAFGFETMIPKHHWLLHFHKHLKRLGLMLNCFVLERKHRIAKRYSTEFKNVVAGSSKSLLMEVTSHHLGSLKTPSVFSFAIGLCNGSQLPSK